MNKIGRTMDVLSPIILAACIVATSVAAQDKPATQTVPFAQILECAKAANCKNMKTSAISWSDVAGIPVIAFTDDRTGYALRVWPEGDLSIWMTLPGETRPTQRLTLGAEGTVLKGELGWMTGDPPMVGTWSPEELAHYLVRHKTFSSPKPNTGQPPIGVEFKTFWQSQAAQALAAIRRQLAR